MRGRAVTVHGSAGRGRASGTGDLGARGFGEGVGGDVELDVELGEKKIGVEFALQVEEKLDGAVGNKEGMDGEKV